MRLLAPLQCKKLPSGTAFHATVEKFVNPIWSATNSLATVTCQPSVTGQLREAQSCLMQETWFNIHNRRGIEMLHHEEGALTGVLEMINLLTTEALNIGALVTLYERASNLYIEAGDDKRLLEFAKKKPEVETYRLGLDNSLTQGTMRHTSDLKYLPASDPQLP